MENKKEFECSTKVEVRKAEFLAADEACKAMEALGLQQRGGLDNFYTPEGRELRNVYFTRIVV